MITLFDWFFLSLKFVNYAPPAREKMHSETVWKLAANGQIGLSCKKTTKKWMTFCKETSYRICFVRLKKGHLWLSCCLWNSAFLIPVVNSWTWWIPATQCRARDFCAVVHVSALPSCHMSPFLLFSVLFFFFPICYLWHAVCLVNLCHFLLFCSPAAAVSHHSASFST